PPGRRFPAPPRGRGSPGCRPAPPPDACRRGSPWLISYQRLLLEPRGVGGAVLRPLPAELVDRLGDQPLVVLRFDLARQDAAGEIGRELCRGRVELLDRGLRGELDLVLAARHDL